MKRKNDGVQYSNGSRNRELTILIQTATELNFEVTVKTVGINRHPMLSLSQTKHRSLLNPSFSAPKSSTSPEKNNISTDPSFLTSNVMRFKTQTEDFPFLNKSNSIEKSHNQSEVFQIWCLWFKYLWRVCIYFWNV